MDSFNRHANTVIKRAEETALRADDYFAQTEVEGGDRFNVLEYLKKAEPEYIREVIEEMAVDIFEDVILDLGLDKFDDEDVIEVLRELFQETLKMEMGV